MKAIMPGYSWDSRTIIDDLAEEECFRALYIQEAESVAEDTGHRFVPDPNLDAVLSGCATRYRAILQNHDGQQGVGADGAIAAVRAMYRVLHEEYVDPRFEKIPGNASADTFDHRLFSISSRGLVAHNFCYKFLVLVGWYHYDIEMFDEQSSDIDAWVEATIKNFEGNVNYSFEQMEARAFRRHKWPQEPNE